MNEKSFEFKLCPSCGSTEYVENYPTPGVSICEECGHEVASIMLKEIQEPDEEAASLKESCPFCGAKNQTEDDNVFFYDGSFNINHVEITVFKCVACGKLNGYRILPRTFSETELQLNEEDFSGETVAIAKTEGRSTYKGSVSKKIVKALKEKEKDPMEKLWKNFQNIAEEKRLKLLGIGTEPLTIDRAIWKVKNYLDDNGPLTKKQLELLFSGAIALAQDELINEGKLKGKKITERRLAEIFNADRKTSRKWKNLLMQPSP